MIKSYTDIEQSKKLAEILPLESADMVYIKHSTSSNPDWRFDDDKPPMILRKISIKDMTVEVLPCWSLAALMKILHCNGEDIVSLSYGGYKDGEYILNWCLDYEFEDGDYKKTFADNPIDSCYNMIIYLHEINLL